jgi:hypothetical protein
LDLRERKFTGEWRMFCNKQLHNIQYSNIFMVIKSRKVRLVSHTCSIYGRGEKLEQNCGGDM